MEQSSNQPTIPSKSQSPIQPETLKKPGLPKWAPILIVVAAITVVALASYGAYRYFAPQAEPAELPAAGEREPADEIANWQVYRNEEYGFEVKYPKDWGIKAEDGDNSIQFFVEFLPSAKSGLTPSGATMSVQPSMKISIINNYSNLSLYQWKINCEQEDTERSGIEITYEILEEADIDGHEFIKVDYPCHGNDCRIVWISDNSIIIDVYGADLGEVFDQILSTFKFIE